MTSLRPPLDSRPPPISWIDVLVAGVTAAAQIGGTALIARFGQPERPPDGVAYALLVTSALSLLVRDRYPRAVLGVVALTASGYMLLGYPGGFYTVSLVFAV